MKKTHDLYTKSHHSNFETQTMEKTEGPKHEKGEGMKKEKAEMAAMKKMMGKMK